MTSRLGLMTINGVVGLALMTLAGCQAIGNGSNDNTEPPANRPANIVVAGPGGTLGSTSVLEVDAGREFTIDATGSSDPDGDALTYSWDFGDGTPVVTGDEVTHTYSEPDEYTLILTATDARGLSQVQNLSVVVSAAFPVAAFTFDPITGDSPLTVTFDASTSSDSDGTIDSYTWDFDDGATGTGQVIEHLFAAGTFDVTLTVTDNDGNTTSDINQIIVNQGNRSPTASFSVSVLSGDAPLSVTFTNTSTDPDDDEVLTFAWDFGDPAVATDTSSALSPQYTYVNAGSYTVTLTVTDSGGLTATSTASITVTESNVAPTAIILAEVTEGLLLEETASAITGVAPLTVEFDGTDSVDPDDGIFGYCWLFGEITGSICDDTRAEGTNESPLDNEYDVAGTYEVELVVTDNAVPGLQSVPDTFTITVLSLDELAVEPTSLSLEVGETAPLLVTGTLSDLSTVVLTEEEGTTYVSDFPAIASVDAATGEVTAMAEGLATITVTRPEAGLDPVLVPVLVFAPLSASIVPPVDTSVSPGTLISLDAIVLGGVGDPDGTETPADLTDDYTYDWNIDVSGAPDSELDDTDFDMEDTKLSEITLDAEGTYLITVSVTDAADNLVTTASISVIATTLDGNVLVDVNGDLLADTCIVGIPDLDLPNGSDQPETTTDDDLVILESGVSDPSDPALTFEWSSDLGLGSFAFPTAESTTWALPVVSTETQITFTVTITKDLGSGVELVVPFSATVNLAPAPELSDICAAAEAPPECTVADLTLSLAEGDTIDVTFYLKDNIDAFLTQQLSLQDAPVGGGAVVDPLCLGGAEFIDPQTCTLTITGGVTGTYTFRERLRDDDCAADQSGTVLQRFDTFFIIEVTE